MAATPHLPRHRHISRVWQTSPYRDHCDLRMGYPLSCSQILSFSALQRVACSVHCFSSMETRLQFCHKGLDKNLTRFFEERLASIKQERFRNTINVTQAFFGPLQPLSRSIEFDNTPRMISMHHPCDPACDLNCPGAKRRRRDTGYSTAWGALGRSPCQ